MQNPYSNRKYFIGIIFIVFALIFLLRLFYIQVVDDKYKFSADNNSQRRVVQYPARGIVYDRSGKILVCNEAAYDIMVIPRQIKAFDTLDLCGILDISKEEFLRQLSKAKSYSYYKPSVFVNQISSKTYAVLQEKLFRFPGFYVQSRTLRSYPFPVAAHLLGYVGEVDEKTIKSQSYYEMGDYIGVSGIERSYEAWLRGKKGVSIYTVDVHNRIMGSFADGRFDTAAVIGSDLTITLDADLQAYGERLMQNKKGSLVAIEPSTGEILVLVSSPSYDPNLLVGRIRSKNYAMLARDSLKPLFNRALMAKYPPGSTFKLINGLVGLQEGVITPQSSFPCAGGYHFGGVTVGCHNHASPLNLLQSIQQSCNAYYCNVFRRIIDNPKYKHTRDGFDAWRRHVMSFGLGTKTGSDLSNELNGNVPTAEYYDKYFGKNRWKSLTIISLAIGQGELGVTPLQMANMGSAIANRGYYYTPHIIKQIKGQSYIDKKFTTKNYTSVDPKYFDYIIDGMEMVVQSGTGRVAKLDSISICGKTGTAQNPHGKDHSIFLAFAPKEKPAIVVAVYVENAGFGSTYAAPIASLIIEKYLTDTIKRDWLEKSIIETNLLKP